MNSQRYLARIGIVDEGERDIGFLGRLQARHATEIPFENLDILAGIPLSLDASDLYRKIVIYRRGGVCYELNGLFHLLLGDLGYSVSLAAATVYVNGEWFIEETHAMNVVRLEGADYLVDVGFGGNTLRRPIPLTGEEISDVDGAYRIRPDPSDRDRKILEKKETAEWEKLYRFTLRSKSPVDFGEVSAMTQCGERSIFNKTLFLMILTDRGRVTLRDHSLTSVEDGRKKKETIEPDKVTSLIHDTFKIG
ncbi:arylamine N-acetyltransferase [Cohnella suwonensis]|uniref:Arylamine N-acetyltransferase n=1 Tax=Cohnella suwonensis TaxID=696072 RepID=A0ABW0LSV9_9BACL